MGQLLPPGVLDRVAPMLDLFDGTTVLGYTPRPGPTDVSAEIGACYAEVATVLRDLTPAQMQVLAWMRAYRPDIERAEQAFRIDRRAIAGAIAWEMLKNVRQWSPRSAGVGKIHLYNYSVDGIRTGFARGGIVGAAIGVIDFDTIAAQTEDAGYLPAQTFASRKALLATPEGAIRYVGAIMAAIADIAARTGFEDIRGNPEILTNVYQGKTLKTWEEHLRGKPPGAPLAGGNAMDIWVRAHLPFIEDGVGRAQVPPAP